MTLALCGTLSLIGMETAMAEDTPEVAALKAEKARVDAHTSLAQSRTEQLKADRDLAQLQADTTSEQAKTEAETQKAIADARKAQAEAQSAAVEAEVATAKAKLGAGTVAASGLTGAVSVGSGSGNFEGGLLAAKAIERAASVIATKLGAAPPASGGRAGVTPRYILFAGTTRPNFGELRLFEAKLQMVEDAYRSAANALAAANSAFGAVPKGNATPPPGPARARTESVAAAVATAGAALDTLSKLGSYFQSDYELSNLTVSGVDADLLAVSLAGQLTDAWYPARWPAPQPAGGVRGLFGQMPARRDDGAEKVALALELQQDLTAQAAEEKNATRKKALEFAAGKYTAAAAAYAAANKAYDDLLASLAETDSAGVPRVSRVAEQKSISDAMDSGARAVMVQVGGAGGTAYTKKNLWTFFGGLPFYVSGGAIVSWVAVDSTGAVKSAGQLPIHSGYLKVREVPGAVNAPAPTN